MKAKLTKHRVQLVDLYGVINNQEVNTLEHLGVKYSWSVYNPSKKSEILEAERGKDELRDILSRMIGSEVRYTRLGYRVRQAPFGYQNQRIETIHGKRFILVPHPIESVWVKRMFELKVQSLYSDQEIVKQINLMGFRTRKVYFRDPRNKARAIGIKGGNQLNLTSFDKFLRNPIYTGITVEVWTLQKPIKCQFEGLVSIETFNKANAGKVMIFEENGELQILKGKVLKKRIVETAISVRYPYRKLVLCSNGRHPFYGSASRGRGNGYFPAYHCDTKRRAHYIRIPVKRFHAAIIDYLQSVRIKDEAIEEFHKTLSERQNLKMHDSTFQTTAIKQRVLQIEKEIFLLIDKIKMLHSVVALQALEIDIEKLRVEKEELLKKEKMVALQKKKDNIANNVVVSTLDRIPEDVINDHNEMLKKQLFEMLFEELPSYDDLLNKTALLRPGFELAL